ncbi:hypothetical protein GCM10022207_61110 [Streptomyces lannensis]|uniref:Secreted protein n=1 Tax=Streptomyces lannensis TaxID=766498 RepID=A0ABP7KR92_9ACTN
MAVTVWPASAMAVAKACVRAMARLVGLRLPVTATVRPVSWGSWSPPRTQSPSGQSGPRSAKAAGQASSEGMMNRQVSWAVSNSARGLYWASRPLPSRRTRKRQTSAGE